MENMDDIWIPDFNMIISYMVDHLSDKRPVVRTNMLKALRRYSNYIIKLPSNEYLIPLMPIVS